MSGAGSSFAWNERAKAEATLPSGQTCRRFLAKQNIRETARRSDAPASRYQRPITRVRRRIAAPLSIVINLAPQSRDEVNQKERLSTNRMANGRPARAPPRPSVNCWIVWRVRRAIC
jgi:hypothetical protein